jgi:hypothetical protein
MKDPFFIPPIPWLSELVQPWCDRFSLPSLPQHIHEVILSAIFYSAIFWPVSPLLSRLIAPQHYSKLSRKRRLNWDAHVVSFIQSTLINIIAIWVMIVDQERKNMDWEERIWGYTGAAGMVQALAAGYFVWDLFVTSFNLDVFGLGTLAHAVAALFVYTLGFVRYFQRCGRIFWSLLIFLPASSCQLLWMCLHIMGIVHALLKHPLVFGQGQHDRVQRATL